ncbi:methyl-accepting chemotaxis protein [Vibrio profundi]|uniref:methyl-accepting chemotaxis protein n=1 Tax=Vibrio profundi TaxID=1774960 RepID=UPI003735ADC5
MRTRLAIFSVLVFGLFAGTFMLYGKLEQRAKEDFHQVQVNLFPASELAVKVNGLFSQYDRQMNNAVMLSEEENVEIASDLFHEIQAALAELETKVSDEQLSFVTELTKALNTYNQTTQAIVYDFIEGEVDMHVLCSRASNNAKTFELLSKNAEQLKITQADNLRQLIAQSEQFADRQYFRFVWFNIIGLSVLMLCAVYALINASRMTKNIVAVTESLRSFASGEGDLSTRIEFDGKGDLASLVEQFNMFVARLENTMISTSKNVSNLVGIAERLTSFSDENRQVIMSQQQILSDTTGDISELIMGVNTISTSANDASKEASLANQSATSSQENIENTIASITALANEVEHSALVVEELVSFSTKAGGAVNTIGEIAEQTNLLALNAAIEAARAGEQGRGFAVVADEVRQIASRTQESTSDIRSMLGELNKISESASKAMNAGVEKAHVGVSESTLVVSVLESITSKVEVMTDLNSQIATAAEQQHTSSKSVDGNLMLIEQTATQATESVQNLVQLSEEIERVTSELHGLTRQFNVD